MAILTFSGRLNEEQSVTNCAKILGGGSFWRIWHVGYTLATAFRSSGRSLLLTSMVALHVTRTSSRDSMAAPHSKQAGLLKGWSMAVLSFVKKSHVKNFRWSRSFCASLVVFMFCRAG